MSDVIEAPDGIQYFHAPMSITRAVRDKSGRQVFRDHPSITPVRFNRYTGMEEYLDGVATFVYDAPEDTIDINAT